MSHLPKHFNRESIDWTRVNRRHIHQPQEQDQHQNLRLQQQTTVPEVTAPPPETPTIGLQQGDLINW